MLVDIEKTVNYILLENNKISENVEELKSRTVKKEQTKIMEVKFSWNFYSEIHNNVPATETSPTVLDQNSQLILDYS